MKAEAQRRVTLIDVEFLEPLLPLESTKDDNFKAAWNNTLHAINDTARCEAILSGPHLDNSRKVTILILWHFHPTDSAQLSRPRPDPLPLHRLMPCLRNPPSILDTTVPWITYFSHSDMITLWIPESSSRALQAIEELDLDPYSLEKDPRHIDVINDGNRVLLGCTSAFATHSPMSVAHEGMRPYLLVIQWRDRLLSGEWTNKSNPDSQHPYHEKWQSSFRDQLDDLVQYGAQREEYSVDFVKAKLPERFDEEDQAMIRAKLQNAPRTMEEVNRNNPFAKRKE